MTHPNETVREKLKGLRKVFEAQLPGKILQIEGAWDGMFRDGWDPQKAEETAQLLHTLAGTAGTFGYTSVRGAARALEAMLRTAVKDGVAPSTGEHLAALKAACGETAVSLPLPAPAEAAPETSPDQPDSDEIFLVDADPLFCTSVADQLRCYGYRVSTFSSHAALNEALTSSVPRIIIMDLFFPKGTAAGDSITGIQQGRKTPVPVMFLSDGSDFSSRLEAVRSGGHAYFVKPVDVGRMVDRLDVLTARRPRAPFRILIIDDEPLLADYHATVLRQAGMTAAVVTEPQRAMDSLIDFRPELILMDVYMPGCSGMELANLIRQDETYIDIPIVYLSSETDVNRQLAAMGLGGDDFLTKPIQPDHLITSVSLRADRYRTLRSFMLYDGLTGLLNHTKTKEQLDIEVSRALRQKTDLSFAMIDIDHFKSVNDTHGHPVGDQVIKSLSRLLKQRLRTTDTIGRFGGEEFAVILTDTDKGTAQRILNELREDFAKIRHTSREGLFPVTFSCGVACPAPGETGAELIEKADKALYRAKMYGRNRVVCEEPGGASTG
ncbi:MAG: diguanylate cyclase [Nitrospirae bacterium]|nr:MAG: diguanylate cyclase [Nitrospirota bacterium]